MNKNILSKLPLRDAFISTLEKLAKRDKKIILITNDQGAPALDNFIKSNPKQFINAGISEQNIIALASGMSIAGFKPYIYSINSFIIYRTLEYIKIDICSMKQPVKIFGVGSGYSYPEDGPTHHSTEDISFINSLSNIEIFNPSDSVMTSKIVQYTVNSKIPCFVRLDRQYCKPVKKKLINVSDGFRLINKSKKNKNFCIITSGFFVSKLSDLIQSKKIDIDLIDFYKLKNFKKKKFSDMLKKYKKILSVEEHSKNFGIGSIISEIITDNFLKTQLLRLGLEESSVYGYGNRDQLLTANRLSNEDIAKSIKKFFK